MVHLVRMLPLSTPRADSVAPEPRAEPIPALALGRCMRTMRVTRRQRRTSAMVKKPIKKVIIMVCI